MLDGVMILALVLEHNWFSRVDQNMDTKEVAVIHCVYH